MIPEDRLQQLISRKDPGEALRWCSKHFYDEGWAIIDGALVIYDLRKPPAWLEAVIARRDEVVEEMDGDTDIVGIEVNVAA